MEKQRLKEYLKAIKLEYIRRLRNGTSNKGKMDDTKWRIDN